MRTITSIAECAQVHGCVLVPTMGALHAGHAALIRAAGGLRREGGGAPVVVSIFVNPTQFNSRTDLARYPRTPEKDAALCARAGADAVFAPAVDVVYPPGEVVVAPPLPEVATRPGLEDGYRPGHFAGVCQVVKRLFDLLRPGAAVFGEKDWQQLQVIRAMVKMQRIPVEIAAVPTVREADGLAMSSRNVFLSAEDRGRARAISRALRDGASEGTPGAAEERMGAVLAEAGMEVDYAVVRDGETLMPGPVRSGRTMRGLIAARVGSVRLIDNAPWPPTGV